jgi:hypothetical protein
MLLYCTAAALWEGAFMRVCVFLSCTAMYYGYCSPGRCYPKYSVVRYVSAYNYVIVIVFIISYCSFIPRPSLRIIYLSI